MRSELRPEVRPLGARNNNASGGNATVGSIRMIFSRIHQNENYADYTVFLVSGDYMRSSSSDR